MANKYLKRLWAEYKAEKEIAPMRWSGQNRQKKQKSAYRSELNKEARRRGHYGNTPPGKDLVHKIGRIAGLGNRHLNRSAGAYKGNAMRKWSARAN